jgi:hypothetical protein
MGCSASKTDVDPAVKQPIPAKAIAPEQADAEHPIHPLMGFAALSANDEAPLSGDHRVTNPAEQTSCSQGEGTSRAASQQFMSPPLLSPNVSRCLTPRVSPQNMSPQDSPAGASASAAVTTPTRRRRPQHEMDSFPSPAPDSNGYVPASPAFAIDQIANFSSIQVDTPATSPLLRRPLTLENVDLHHRSESRRLIHSYNSNNENSGGEPRTWEERMSQWVSFVNQSSNCEEHHSAEENRANVI